MCVSWEEEGSSGYCEYTIESVDVGDGRAGNKVYCVRDDLIDRLFVCLFVFHSQREVRRVKGRGFRWLMEGAFYAGDVSLPFRVLPQSIQPQVCPSVILLFSPTRVLST